MCLRPLQNIFLAKFKTSGKLAWGTYYGDVGYYNNGYGVSIDPAGYIYICGVTASSSGIATPGSYQSTYIGIQNDAFLAQFNENGILTWGTYYGGSLYDGGYGVSADPFGNIYMAGTTTSTNGIATSGSFQQNIIGNSGSFITKFNFPTHNDAGIVSILSPKDSLCPGLHIIELQLKNFGNNEIDSLNIGFSINGVVQKIFKWTGAILPDSSVSVKLGNFLFHSGKSIIKGWTSKVNGQTDFYPFNDSSSSFVNSYPFPNAIAGPDTTICYNQIYTMKGAGGISYLWTPAKYLSNDKIANPKAALPNAQLYTLYVTNTYGCIDSSQVLLKVHPKLKVKINEVQSPVCFGTTINLNVKGSGGDSLHYSFYWPFDSATGKSINKKILGSSWHYVILNDNCTPKQAIDSVFIDTIPKPKADFNILNSPPFPQHHIIKFNNISKNAISYFWNFDDNHTSILTNPWHIYEDTGLYKIMLLANSPKGCQSDTNYAFIRIISDEVRIFIPNAFTPNLDNTNDVFDIKGIGMIKYIYNIYNRWGEHIFQSSTSNSGWDGKYKGETVPGGVYLYQIDVTDIDGEHHYLNGTVTVIK